MMNNHPEMLFKGSAPGKATQK